MASNSKDRFIQHYQVQSGTSTNIPELDLIDVWIKFRRFKRYFLTSFSLVLVLVTSYVVFFHLSTYQIVSTIMIGSIERDNIFYPLEAPNSLLSKIENSLLPSFAKQWSEEAGIDFTLDTVVVNPDGTNIILIKNTGTEEELEKISSFQEGMISIIQDDHARLIEPIKTREKVDLNLAKLKLDKLNNPLTLDQKLKVIQIKLDEGDIKLKKLEDERYFGIEKAEFQNSILREQHEQKKLSDTERVLTKQLERIEETKKLLMKNIEVLEKQIQDAEKSKKSAAYGATELSAMSQLLIENEIQQNQARLISLEERYYVDMESEKANIRKKIEEVRLNKVESEKNLELLDGKYQRILLNNQFSRDQQKINNEEMRIELEQVKYQHKSAIAEQEELIKRIRTKLDNFHETRAVTASVPSLKKPGLSRSMIMALGLVLAAMVGFFVVFVAYFREKVRERIEEIEVTNAKNL